MSTQFKKGFFTKSFKIDKLISKEGDVNVTATLIFEEDKLTTKIDKVSTITAGKIANLSSSKLKWLNDEIPQRLERVGIKSNDSQKIQEIGPLNIIQLFEEDQQQKSFQENINSSSIDREDIYLYLTILENIDLCKEVYMILQEIKNETLADVKDISPEALENSTLDMIDDIFHSVFEDLDTKLLEDLVNHKLHPWYTAQVKRKISQKIFVILQQLDLTEIYLTVEKRLDTRFSLALHEKVESFIKRLESDDDTLKKIDEIEDTSTDIIKDLSNLSFKSSAKDK
ncbi:hypothetical protein BN7_4587 [Wickerhamomyces ciferrii]|uniref:Uncharacterized protein n=1 Tax=Wickerhamomyces ciferrii (strain ATCC 14091 / BCRC 22168 / CBS 111 / JCM 3599 / NBRC 0793 / NRRL Y-1031 F-60-10) TaxID=1206466 RepID=K0KV16_WICCF|nr:uncharacterized protein BN7_4587 [Wickerhamomyces ciferrii]CCH45008.1 hypothetical protein BN7_4587 [Wickerhamomyces ciferrii]